MSLTVGQAAGVINLAVVAAQVLLPLAIAILLTCVISEQNSAATWSVITRILHSTWWPTILRSDSATAHNVSYRVTSISLLVTFCLFLLVVAGVVTPLGLSEAIKDDSAIYPGFQYAPDESAFGRGTSPRYSQFTRLCGQAYLMNCPGRFDGVMTTADMNGSYEADPIESDAYFNSSIPANLTEIFNSATSETTLTGAFDIQYRAWGIKFDAMNHRLTVDHGKPVPAGTYRPLTSLLLNNKIEVLEGVIVDTINPGVGYRNHTVPKNLSIGGTWTEDITWIEPVTECADTNLTLELSVAQGFTNISNVDLVDNGGFTYLPVNMPYMDDIQLSQDPNLAMKSYQAAYRSNSLLMRYLNISGSGQSEPSNTSIGRHFTITSDVHPYYNPTLYSIALTNLQPSFIQIFPDYTLNTSETTLPKLSVSYDEWNSMKSLCSGNASSQEPSIFNMGIMCGYLFGAPKSITHNESRIFQPYSKYRQNLYTCATGLRASIKQVDFSIKGTAALENLHVARVTDKTYADNASRPLWAVEKTYRPTYFASPLWGMVDDIYEFARDLSTIRADKFWLPAISTDYIIQGLEGRPWPDSLASTNGIFSALIDTYKGSTQKSGIENMDTGSTSLVDYSGSNNAALNQFWQSISNSPSEANKVINLIFTEVLATATVGTKTSTSGLQGAKSQKVRQYRRRLEYKLEYAIPAFIVLLITLLVTIGVIICFFTRFSIRKMSQLLNQTSTGRVVTNLVYPDLSRTSATTREWLVTAGGIRIEQPFQPSSELDFTDSSGEQNKRASTDEQRSQGEESTAAEPDPPGAIPLNPDHPSEGQHQVQQAKS